MARKSIADIRKAEIIEAFLKVVSEKGLSKATVREVAEAAGCRHGMLRHFFGNKDTMIVEALNYVTHKYWDDFRNRSKEYDSSADELKNGIYWWLDRDQFDIDWGRTEVEFWVYSRTNPIVSEALNNYYSFARSTIAGIIRRGIEAGEFREVDAVITADMMLAEVNGLISLWYVNPEKISLKTMAKQVAELFEGYLKKQAI